MTIQLTFDSYPEMLKFCAEALEHQRTEPVKLAPALQEQIATHVPEPVPETVAAPDPENDTTPTKEAQPEPAASTEQKYTLSEVRAYLGNLRKEGHKEEVSALIRELGYEKFTEIPEEKFSELMEKARRI